MMNKKKEINLMNKVKDMTKKVSTDQAKKVVKNKIKFAIVLKLLPVLIPILLLGLIFVLVLGVSMSSVQESDMGAVDESCIGGELNDDGKAVFEKNAKGGALEGKADEIIKIAKKYDIPPTLFFAIIASESEWGKGANATKQKNPLSVMGNGTIHDNYFDSIEEGLEVGAKNLKTGYIDEGLNTPEKIGPKYAPTVGAVNDPTGMNNNWIPTVKSIMKSLGGSDVKCTSKGGKLSVKDIGSPVDPKLLSRKSCGIGDYSGHPGIDIAIDIGTPIYAISDGKVIQAVDGFTIGGLDFGLKDKANHVVVVDKKNPNLFMGYWHLKTGGVKVKKGDTVKAGQQIGLSGNTGFSSGPHLHLHVLKDNVYDISHAVDWYSELAKKYNVKSSLGCGL
ncbi:peptidoglycan DD-metalloendopeptidase family protein [Macrococcus armenti]|uniref:peptidoglycan DD-metalloendopeptidase family protein n=1 Tax=Macrococcus armenti TaxID=2875764 RepID=UPI001CC989B2|nr:peptidoglycan DD-metalloendopeptidase family protein [Macrococcus armenti]UBH13599.1 peptidoglycan DD-metalloendopeptidase family protein [Macrococcus armenti]